MMRVQLDLLFTDDGSPADHAAMSREVDDMIDTLAGKFGSPGILRWSVAPLPSLRPILEPERSPQEE